MSYSRRLAAASLLLALATVLAVLTGGTRDVAVVAKTPIGSEVSAGAPISLTFGRAVDRASAEKNLAIAPPVRGRFFWQGQQLTFRPTQPLLPNQDYTVTLRAGLADERGERNREAFSWSFRTRPARLLLIGSNTLTVINADGSDPQVLAREPQGIEGVSVAPDGSQLLYGAKRDADRSALLLLNVEDSTSKPLVEAPDVSAGVAAWSPQGDIIAYERRTLVNGAVGPPHLWLAQPDGTTLGPLYTGQDISFAPAFSPDGSKLAFTNGLSQTLDLFDFTNRRITFPDSTGEPASWAPDGSALVYSSYGSSSPAPKTLLKLAQIGARGGEPKPLTAGAQGETSPAWSPDGSWIAFVQRSDDGASSSIALIRPSGSGLRQLTQSGGASDQLPAWSPDGKRVAFVRAGAGGGQGEAWVVPLEGGEARRVAEGVARAVWVP